MSKLIRAFEHYNPQHFEGVDVLTVPQKWRVMSNIRYKDLKDKVRGPEATVHVCRECGSTGFQIHEVRPPRDHNCFRLARFLEECSEFIHVESMWKSTRPRSVRLSLTILQLDWSRNFLRAVGSTYCWWLVHQ